MTLADRCQQVAERLTAFQQRLVEHASASKNHKIKSVKPDRGRCGTVTLERIEGNLSVGFYRDNLTVDECAGWSVEVRMLWQLRGTEGSAHWLCAATGSRRCRFSLPNTDSAIMISYSQSALRQAADIERVHRFDKTGVQKRCKSLVVVKVL